LLEHGQWPEAAAALEARDTATGRPFVAGCAAAATDTLGLPL
jgi:hypothetical protein